MRRLLLILAALTVAPAATASAAAPPVADTAAAKDVGQTQATLTAKVDPAGSATSVRFDLGTSTTYGLQSAAKDAGSGNGQVTVEIPVQGLTPATTYHYRVQATSAGGTAQGADVTFTTDAVPVATSKPAVSSGGVRSVTPGGATLTGAVNPHGAPTTYHFDYGTSRSYGSSTAPADAGSGTSTRTLTAAIGGLQAGKTYHYRIVAVNARGTTNGGDRSFKTATTPTGTTLTADTNPVVYGRPAVLRGRLSGTRTSGVRVRLQTTAFPFNSPFADTLKAVKSSSSGSFSFTLPALTLTTRAVVIADGAPPVLSAVVVLRSAVRTGITSVRRAGRSVIVSGRLTPATAQGVAALQRQGANGRWVPLRRARGQADGRYTITVRSRRKAMLIRTVGLPHDGGGHVRGTSRTVRVAGRG